MKPLPDRSDAELEDALRASRTLADAPEGVIQRAIDLFQPRVAVAPTPGLLRRVLAALTFDSGAASPLAFGMRSSGGALRQLLYSVEGRDIDLRIAPAEPSRFALSGQVLGPDSQGIVVLADESGARREAPLSDLGEFRLPPVGAGRYRITLELADMAIDLPPVEVPQDPMT